MRRFDSANAPLLNGESNLFKSKFARFSRILGCAAGLGAVLLSFSRGKDAQPEVESAPEPGGPPLTTRLLAAPPRPGGGEAMKKVNILMATEEVMQHRHSIYFDESKYVNEYFAANPEGMSEVLSLLASPPKLSETLQRMTAIDMSGEVLESKRTSSSLQMEALHTLKIVVEQQYAENLSRRQRVILEAEKFDALVILTRFDEREGIAAWQELATGKSVLASAVMTGLIDRGMPQNQAKKMIETLVAE